MKFIKTFTVIVFIIFVSSNSHAFRTVKHTSYIDPEHQNHKAKRILIMVNSPSKEIRFEIEKYLIKYLSKSKVKLITFNSLFPPTRQWTMEQVASVLSKSNLDSWLVVNQGIRNKTITPFMTTTQSNTNITGNYNSNSQYNGYGSTTSNGAFNANARTSSNSYTTNLHKSTAEFNARLLDVKSGQNVWVIDLVVKAGGSLFTTNKGDAKGVSKRIVKALIDDGIVIGK